MNEKIESLFSDFNPIESEDRVEVKLNDSFSVLELINIYVSNKLYETYSLKFWGMPKERDNRFFLYVQYREESQDYEVAYNYALDESNSKNYYTLLYSDAFSTLSIKDEKVDRIEFIYRDKITWDFIRDSHKHPQFSFIIGNVCSNIRFSKSGYSTYENEYLAMFYITSSEIPNIRYTFEYNKENHGFTLRALDKFIEFNCSFEHNKWVYNIDDKEYQNISEVFELLEL